MGAFDGLVPSWAINRLVSIKSDTIIEFNCQQYVNDWSALNSNTPFVYPWGVREPNFFFVGPRILSNTE